MRVIHLDTGRELRGGQRQVLLLHHALLAVGVDSLVVAPRGSPLAARCRQAGWPVATVTGRRPWHPGVVGGVRGFARSADVLHLHDPHATTLAGWAVGASRSPLVVCHRRAGFAPRRGLAHRLKYRRVDRWIAVTEAVRASLVAWGVSPARIRTVHSAIDLELVRTTAAAGGELLRRQLAPPDVSLVVAVGALDHQKGFAVLARALAKIKDDGREVHAVVVGEGRERVALENLAVELGLQGRLQLVGWREDVPAVLAVATMCVVPSRAAEGSSAVVKEALAVGCPLLASRLPGMVEIAGEAAHWFPPGDDQALAAAILEQLENPGEARRRVAVGRARVLSFGVGKMVAAVREVYRDGLAEIAGDGSRC